MWSRRGTGHLRPQFHDQLDSVKLMPMMMKRLLTILCIPAVLLLGSTEGWSLPACEGDSLHTSAWTNCFGTYTFPDGEKYVGEWKDDKYHGQGTFTSPDGTKYVGEYRDGNMHRQGTYTFPDGEKYVGEWKDDKRHGQGTLTFANGRVKKGIWSDGELLE